MINDPTAISVEVAGPAGWTRKRFATAIGQLVGGTGLGGANFEYTFLPAEMENNEHPFVGQCTELAVVVLCTWLHEFKNVPGCTELKNALFKMANSQNMNERNLLQGKMMQFIPRWNKSIDRHIPSKSHPCSRQGRMTASRSGRRGRASTSGIDHVDRLCLRRTPGSD